MICSWTRRRVAAVAILALVLPGVAQAQRIKLATLVPDGSIWDRSLKEMGATWRADTKGRVKLDIFAGGVAGDEDDMVRKLRIGQIQACLFTASGLGQIEPAFNVFEIPMLFESDAEIEFVLDGIKADFEKRLESQGYVMLHWAHAGWMHVFSSKPIESYDDFERLKHFVWGGGTRVAKWYEELGIRTVPLSAPDVQTGLQTGLVDVVPSTPLAALSLQWFRTAPYMFERRLAPLVGGTVVSERVWRKISDADKTALLAAAKKAEERIFRDVPQDELEALKEMQNRGLTVTKIKTEDLERWQALAAHFKQRMRANSVPRDAFDAVDALLKEFRAQNEATPDGTSSGKGG